MRRTNMGTLGGIPVFLLLTLVINQGRCNILTLFQNCCAAGTKHGNSGLPCKNYEIPPNVPASQQNTCLSSLDVCCKNTFRDSQCNLGKQDAKDGKDCSSSGEFRKDCCLACTLGIQTRGSGASCENLLGFGSPYDKAFTSCCEETPEQTSTEKTSTTTLKSTTVSSTSEIPTTSKPSFANDSRKDSTPTLENICYFPDVCAQICIPTPDSYKCACREGYTLMSDGISCKINKKIIPTANNKPSNRCESHNPCDHNCEDTGVSVKCTCYAGYELAKNKVSCIDIDECETGTHACAEEETCVNEEGTYACESMELYDDYDDRCEPGFIFNADKKTCEDVDECAFSLVCTKPQVCENTQGSYKCIAGETPKCPPGFYYKESIEDCQDVDECINGQHDCNRESQTCLNTIGSFTCIDKTVEGSCPPGFKKNSVTLACEDINECVENQNVCAPHEECVNESGGHNCVPKRTTAKPFVTPKEIQFVPKPEEPVLYTKPTATTTSTTTTPVPITTTTTKPTTTISTTMKPITTLKPTPEIRRIPLPHRPMIPTQHPRIYPKVSCPLGLKYSDVKHICEDVNECQEENECDSNQNCRNTHGSYRCDCKSGFQKDFHTGACTDINECQLGQHDCTDGQRCDNTIGSYLCSRTAGCGTGYTLNYANGICEDDDECYLGTHNCNLYGPGFQCKNTLGSFRCEKIPRAYRPQSTSTRPNPFKPVPHTSFKPTATAKPPQVRPYVSVHKQCLHGYKKNAKGECEDVNECLSNPCGRGQKCLNLNGSFQCVSTLQCVQGYELNGDGTECVDVDECARGLHECSSTQICRNAKGYYMCECPPGHSFRNKQCEDIDECQLYRVCSAYMDCINTVGSFECRCKSGLRSRGSSCDDIDECSEIPYLCEQKCVNVFAGYRCSCEKGFTLNPDNRTCTDVDECDKFSDHNLCVGICENTPGSYACSCPKGYTLGTDGRACQDIDECQNKICTHPDDICINTRGGYKCHRLICPPNYVRDQDHKSRCKRSQFYCDPRDDQCMQQPFHYTYHFLSFTSMLPIVHGHVDFFQMRGPTYPQAWVDFAMKIEDARCPAGVRKVDASYFKMRKFDNKALLSIVKPIQGPQEIDVQLELLIQHNGMRSRMIAKILLIVTQYTF